MGDGALVLRRPDGMLLAVVDGVGHGAEAADVRRAAEEIIQQAAGVDVRSIAASCHEGLKATRGATLGLVWLDRGAATASWLGVGTVAGVLHRAGPGPRGSALLMPQGGGALGRRLPALHPALVPVHAGDTIVLATDGLDRRFIHEVPGVFQTEQQIADRIIDLHASGRDDALVLVARCTGAPA